MKKQEREVFLAQYKEIDTKIKEITDKSTIKSKEFEEKEEVIDRMASKLVVPTVEEGFDAVIEINP